MAEAASKQLDWLEKQFLITFAEVIALVVTIYFTATAAIAASKAVQLAIRVDRPYLRLSRTSLRNIHHAAYAANNADDRRHHIWLDVTVRNVGTRAGFIRAIAVRDIEALPVMPPDIDLSSADEIAHQNVAPNDVLRDELNVWQRPITAAEARGIYNGTVPIHIYGFIQYVDIHGTSRRTGFAYKFDRANEHEWVSCGPISYWYDIEEQAEKQPQYRNLARTLFHRVRSTFRL